MNEESDGTQRLFGLYSPLSDALKYGLVLVIDELDRSLHPLLCRKIIELFQDKTKNLKGAQLIFSTHDVSVLDKNLLRRDQVWFVEKGNDYASNLFSLSDIAARKDEAFAKAYLSGRYGAIPILNDLEG